MKVIPTLVFIAFVASASVVSAQTFVDFPVGYGNVPEQAMKGPVHTVLTIEQRDEHVFRTEVALYDEKGRITEQLSSNANIEVHSGKLVRLGGKTTYNYNSSGQAFRGNNFTVAGELISYDLRKYDAKERLVEVSLFDAAGRSRGWKRYTYAPDRKEVEATWHFIYPPEPPRGNPMRSTLVYDASGRWISRTMYLSSSDTVTFEYDRDGNLVKEMHGGHGFSFTYIFDKHGNWIERAREYHESSDPNKGSSIDMNTYRVITYYPDLKIVNTKP